MSTVEERRAELAKRKPTVVIDWDGTLVEQKWPEMGDWLPGAVEAVEDLLNAGYRVIVHSCRTHSNDLDDVTPLPDWKVQLEVDAIRAKLDEADLGIVDIYTSNKPPADAYIDDKAVRFAGNWRATVRGVLVNGLADGHSIPTAAFLPHAEPIKDPYVTKIKDGLTIVNRDPGDETWQTASEANWSEAAQAVHPPLPPGTQIISDDIAAIRIFETGATRNLDADKPDLAKYLSPLVLRRFGEYMAKNAVQADGSIREGDNWKKGIPLDSFLSSGWRHLLDWWLEHDGFESREGLEDALCGLLFNAMGYLHETLKGAE